MRNLRGSLLAGISVIAVVGSASAAWGQDLAANEVEELVVTGSRGEARSKLETVAPVDVVSTDQITRAGNTELAQALSVALPSLNFPRPTLTDGTDTIRPATLRGLAPDQVLVLVNSKRRHSASLVNVNGSVGRGAAAVDLNTIPAASIGSVEVLRDGASAQYGSDAIAGVINIRLKEAATGGGASVTIGERLTDVPYSNAATIFGNAVVPTHNHRSDGDTTTVSLWQGLPLGDKGFLTLAGEGKIQSRTIRSGVDPRQQYPLLAGGAIDPREQTANRITGWYGDPQMEQYTGFANAGYDLTDNVHLYGWASYQDRDAISAGFFRRPLQATTSPTQNILSIYPDGFLPKINGHSVDYAGAGGLTFTGGGWDWDASVVYGRNRLHFQIIDTLNASIGPSSATSFDSGALLYQQTTANLGATRQFDAGSFESVNVAFGLEARWENYQIEAGEPDSYRDGGYRAGVGVPAAYGAQVFPGFTPADEKDEDRNSQSAYVDVDAKVTSQFEVDAAVRGEHYSDFGSIVTGKLAARYDVNDNVAFRGAVSNGFRAPSLQQSFFTSTSTNFINGEPFQVLTVPAGSATAKLLGSEDLKAEKSKNASIGAVLRGGGFSLTVDGYFIKIKDRIALSENLTQANVVALLPPGITGVRFFTNGVDTETKGLEAVGTYRWTPSDEIGRFDFTASGAYNKTKLTRLPTTNVLSALNPAPLLIARVNSLTLTDGQPKYKAGFNVDWTHGIVEATAKATYYGKVLQPGTTAANDLTLEDKTLFDLEVRVKPNDQFTFALGGENIFDVYPTNTPPNLNSSGIGAFPEYSPFGFQGRYVYARASYNW